MSLVLSKTSLNRLVIALSLCGVLLPLVPTDASAQYYRRRGPSSGAVAAGVVGGLALGALAAGAARPYYYGAPPYGGPGPAYVMEDELPPPPRPRLRCWFEREDVWDGYGYVPRRVRVCR